MSRRPEEYIQVAIRHLKRYSILLINYLRNASQVYNETSPHQSEMPSLKSLVVQTLRNVHFSVTPWAVAHQASLSFATSQSLLKFMSIELVMLSNHLIPHHPLLLLPSVFPSIMVFSMSQLFTSGGQSIKASASVLSMNIQGWFPSGLTDLIFLWSKGL